jgi:hypothetical protein
LKCAVCHAQPRALSRQRARCVAERLCGLVDEPRPGRPRTITDAHLEQVIVATLERRPTNATDRSTRSMPARLGLSRSAVLRIWQAVGLQPHRQNT